MVGSGRVLGSQGLGESGRREMTGGTQKSIKRKRKERVFGISGWVGQIPVSVSASGDWDLECQEEGPFAVTL